MTQWFYSYVYSQEKKNKCTQSLTRINACGDSFMYIIKKETGLPLFYLQKLI